MTKIPSPRRALTVLELVCVIAVLGILLLLIFPVMSQVREASRLSLCVQQQRQIVNAILLYAGEHQGTLPYYGAYTGAGSTSWDGKRFWEQVVAPWLSPNLRPGVTPSAGGNFLRCPSTDQTRTGPTYGVNYPVVFGVEHNANHGRSMKVARVPLSALLLTDVESMSLFYSPKKFPFTTKMGDYGMNDSFASHRFNFTRPRHNGKLVGAFVDGRVEVIPMINFLRNENDLWGPAGH